MSVGVSVHPHLLFILSGRRSWASAVSAETSLDEINSWLFKPLCVFPTCLLTARENPAVCLPHLLPFLFLKRRATFEQSQNTTTCLSPREKHATLIFLRKSHQKACCMSRRGSSTNNKVDTFSSWAINSRALGTSSTK